MRKILGLAFLALAALAAGAGSAESSLIDEVRRELRERIEGRQDNEKMFCRSELLCASRILPSFYRRRSFDPVWIGEPGQAEALLGQIRQADREGLDPEDYRLSTLRALLAEVGPNPGLADRDRLTDLELLLTDTFLIYASHLLHGRVDPESIRAEWHVQSRKADLAEVLQKAAEQNKIAEALQSLLPPHPGYSRLRLALEEYRQIALRGGWPRVPAGTAMRRGQQDGRVTALRFRLAVEGGPSAEQGASDLFDEALERAVILFQGRHGLDGDGIVGSATLEALNVPVEDRLRQIKVNMERWRWLPQDLGARHIFVNIVDFTLQVIDANRPVMHMRTVVGKSYQRTPVFSALLTAVVARPYWNIPRSIVLKEIFPAVRRDPDYLSKNRIRVLSGWEVNAREIDPSTIPWGDGETRRFGFRMRQDAGPGTALGR
ncbi:MAG: peptidoglycan-binding protein, partial [Thermodesulfobacteriota bacterium]